MTGNIISHRAARVLMCFVALTCAAAGSVYSQGRPAQPLTPNEAGDILAKVAQYVLLDTELSEVGGQPTARALLSQSSGTVVVAVDVAAIDRTRDPANADALAAMVTSAVRGRGLAARGVQSRVVDELCPLIVIEFGRSERQCSFALNDAMILAFTYPQVHDGYAEVPVSTFVMRRKPNGDTIRSNHIVRLEFVQGRWTVRDIRLLRFSRF
jgi:hypothetical protein